ncbi:DivIVA domain-containing protein [Buchananella felis]|uniref:DivIVA domain-containing protein n=1 Tax=Buchananella felis TaxID=3231492 RepID=UPI0035276F91
MSDLFATVGKLSSGYGRLQVDEFFARARQAYEAGSEGDGAFTARTVRNATFPITRGGYNMGEVDEALDRIESAFVQRERAEYIAVHGRQSWLDNVAERAKRLYPRLLRPAGERFAHPAKGRGYKASEVDALCDRLTAYFNEGRSITSSELRFAAFTSARGEAAYAEAPVDAFLAAAVEVLLCVE